MRASVRRSEIGAPSRVIVPEVGAASESRSLTSVVLPARFGPSRPNTLAGRHRERHSAQGGNPRAAAEEPGRVRLDDTDRTPRRAVTGRPFRSKLTMCCRDET